MGSRQDGDKDTAREELHWSEVMEEVVVRWEVCKQWLWLEKLCDSLD